MVQIRKPKSFHNLAVCTFFCLVAKHGKHFFPLATIVTFSIASIAAGKHISPNIDRSALSCRPWDLHDNDFFLIIINGINVFVQQNILAYFLWVIQSIPKLRNHLFRIFNADWYQLLCLYIFLHTKQDDPAICVGKRRISFPHALRHSSCCRLDLYVSALFLG